MLQPLIVKFLLGLLRHAGRRTCCQVAGNTVLAIALRGGMRYILANLS